MKLKKGGTSLLILTLFIAILIIYFTPESDIGRYMKEIGIPVLGIAIGVLVCHFYYLKSAEDLLRDRMSSPALMLLLVTQHQSAMRDRLISLTNTAHELDSNAPGHQIIRSSLDRLVDLSENCLTMSALLWSELRKFSSSATDDAETRINDMQTNTAQQRIEKGNG